MKIGKKELENNLIFAPLAGVSDVGMRHLCSVFGADATFTEMLSARAMFENPKKTRLMTLTSPAEKVCVAQIFGKEPKIMANIANCEILKDFDCIDINMGCPAPKIVKNGEGSALMKNPILASQIITECTKTTQKPISVKMRLGFSQNNATDFARMCEESGASFVTVHGRLQTDLFSGYVDLEEIAKVKSVLSIPVIGNGDVTDRKSYENMLQTGVDGVMIGRGAQGKPWIFSEILGKDAKVNRFEIAKKHVEILRENFDEKWIKLYMRKHFLWYVGGLENASKYRLQLATSNDIDQSLEMIKKIIEEN